jgi:cobalamin synthase
MHKLYESAIYNNHWLWSHILLGGLLAKILNHWISWQGYIIGIVIAVAVVFEIFQWLLGPRSKKNFMDAIGDVMGALIMAAIVIF